MREFETVGVIGAGAWGTALAAVAARAGRQVTLWGRDGETIAALNERKENPRYLPGIVLTEGIAVTTDLAGAAKCDLVLLVTPAQTIRQMSGALRSLLRPETPVVLCAKGIERKTGELPGEVLGETLPETPTAVLSGPSFAADVARGLPTAVTVAAEDIELAEAIGKALSSATFRPYASRDIVGVEIAGALKNVMAIAAGAVAGKKLGKSAEAALVARGFAEIRRFAATRGAQAETLMGLAGLGDLVLTCSSPQSRNYAFGIHLGEGAAVADLLASGQPLAEGAHTAGIASDLAKAAGIDMPITETVAAIVRGRLDMNAAIAGLMRRPLKREE